MLACNKIANVKRRAERARCAAPVTCAASRHVMLMADAIAAGRTYRMFEDEPELCAGSIYGVLESLWKARAKLQQAGE